MADRSKGGGIVKKISTGIDGMDKLLYGGIPENEQILLAGGPGAGKTLLSFEILYRNAKNGVPSTLISFEEEPEDIIRNAKSVFDTFNDIDDLISSGKLAIEKAESYERIYQKGDDTSNYSFGHIVSEIEDMLSKNKAKLIVIDSISIVKLLFPDVFSYRRSMMSLTQNLRRLGVTAIFTYELQTSSRQDLKFTREFFMFDGVIILYQAEDNEKRSLVAEVVKTRGTNHSWVLSPYEITPEGFSFMTVN